MTSEFAIVKLVVKLGLLTTVDPEVIEEPDQTRRLFHPCHHNYGSLSHQRDDEEDDGASRASTPSPTTYLNSLKPLDYQQYEVPTSFEQNDDLLFERQTAANTRRQ
ncbi:hypothetical protein Tco_0038376 [Tanacetum coccineum]